MEEKNGILETTLFGPIKVDLSTAITFPEGLIGFPDCKRFLLLDDEKISPLQWFQSVDRPELVFTVLEPSRVIENFKLEFWKDRLDIIDADDIEKVHVLLVVVLASKLEDMTVNLKGPILINPRNRKAVQIINDIPEYSTRHKLTVKILPN